MMNAGDHAWVIVLAGGEGSRLRGRTVREIRFDRPKQFCRVDGSRTLLASTLERARHMAPPTRTLPVVCEAHRRWWQSELTHVPPENVLSQPANRGNAIAIFHALFQILRRDRNPLVVVLPSDFAVDREEVLQSSLEHAMGAARELCDRLVLLGMTPEFPEPQYGWIVPGPAGPLGTRRVDAFHEKPSGPEAAALLARGALWSSLIFTGTAIGLLRLFDEVRPDLLQDYPESMLARERDRSALEGFYQRGAAVDFGRDVMARSAPRLRVLPVPPCGWTDLGTPERVEAWLMKRVPTPRRPATVAPRCARSLARSRPGS